MAPPIHSHESNWDPVALTSTLGHPVFQNFGCFRSTYLTLPPTGAAEARPLLNIRLRLAAPKALRDVPANNLGRTIVKKTLALRLLSNEKKIAPVLYELFAVLATGSRIGPWANGSAHSTPNHPARPAPIFIG